jgi:hypothetical protein
MQFSCNLHRNSTVKRCEIGKYESSLDFPNEFFTNQTVFTNSHLLKAELRCKLLEKLHRSFIHWRISSRFFNLKTTRLYTTTYLVVEMFSKQEVFNRFLESTSCTVLELFLSGKGGHQLRLLLPKNIKDMEEMNRGLFKTAMSNALDALRLLLYP